MSEEFVVNLNVQTGAITDAVRLEGTTTLTLWRKLTGRLFRKDGNKP